MTTRRETAKRLTECSRRRQLGLALLFSSLLLPPTLLLAAGPARAQARPLPPAEDEAQANAAYQLGMRYLEQGSPERAERLFRRAIQLLPQAPGPYRGLGLSLQRQGDCEGAIEALGTYVARLAAAPGAAAPNPLVLRAIEDCRARRRSMAEPRGGSLVVSASPPGASVSVDGKPAGTAPLTLLDLAPGKHALRLVLEGHGPVAREVTIEPGKTVSLQLRLARTAQLQVLSQPAGATLALDGQPLGRTPVSRGDLEAGTHALRLDGGPAQRPWQTALELPPGGALTLTVPLAAEGGLLAVRSEPPGALVTLDEMPVGCTPLGPNVVAAGSHSVSVALPGFALEERAVELAGSRAAELDLRLRPVRLDLKVRGVDDGAQIFVDGERLPLQDGWLRGLPPGEHEIAAVSEGYPIWSRRVRLEQGSAAEVEVPRQGGASGSSRGWWMAAGAATAAASLAAAAVVGYQAVEGDGGARYIVAAALAGVGVASAALTLQLWLAGEGPPPWPPESPEHDGELHAAGAPLIAAARRSAGVQLSGSFP